MGKATQRNGGVIGDSKISKTPMAGSTTMGSGVWGIEEHSAISQIQGLAYAEINSSTDGITREYVSGGVTYRSHEMNSSGNVTFYAGGPVDFFVLGGGGAGSNASSGQWGSGGGGGGARIVNNVSIGTNDVITCTIAAQGAWSHGNQSIVTSSGTFSDGDGHSRILCEGGGRGGTSGSSSGHGGNGSSGGYVGYFNWSGPVHGKANKQSTPATYGNTDGVAAEYSGDQGNVSSSYHAGGASTSGPTHYGFGNDYGTGSTVNRGGGGGKGLSYSQAQGGAQRYWGVHGGGHGAQGNWGHGGDGPANQGGGGGGAGYAGSQGGKGGSGVVVMRYKIG